MYTDETADFFFEYSEAEHIVVGMPLWFRGTSWRVVRKRCSHDGIWLTLTAW
jgi:hypothetical protein